MAAGAGDPLLSVEDLVVQFPTDQGVIKAADGVSFEVWPDEVLGIVGESGSGKTVTALSVLRLLPSTARFGGTVSFRGQNLLDLPESDLRTIRGDRIAVVFQDALAALNPLHRVGGQIAEAIRIHHHDVSRHEAKARAVALLDQVGISNPERRARQFPHEFSGGMRQRALIAMAIANEPDVLIADEPTTALDVTTQAQVLEVLKAVRGRTHSALLLISHDLGVVAGVADRVIVMYAGRVVETGPVEQVLIHPAHPYTQGLLASMPQVAAGERRLNRIAGQPPSLIDVPPGCAFHPRCPYARLPEPCTTLLPQLSRAPEEPGSTAAAPAAPPPGGPDGTTEEHLVACHFSGRLPEGADSVDGAVRAVAAVAVPPDTTGGS